MREVPQTMEINTHLPMAHEYEGSQFYVRDCYHSYYKLLISTMETKKYITLTGTPGIGKSVFYIFFFHKFRAENPSRTIVTASFNDSRDLSELRIHGPERPNQSEGKIPIIPGALYLFDGPPNQNPKGQMVCFTIPHEKWVKVMDSKFISNHLVLYSPLWSLEELKTANDWLSLGIDPQELERRFKFFGGVARICLSSEQRNVDKMECSLKMDCMKTRTLFDVAEILKDVSPESVNHRLIHLVPLSDPTFSTMTFASKLIFQLISESIHDTAAGHREALLNSIRAVPHHEALLGNIFEIDCHVLLRRERSFHVKPLGGGPHSLPSQIKVSSDEEYVRVDAPNYPGIDSYYFDESRKRLLLFQITLAFDHPINVKGIRKLFDKLRIIDCLDSIQIGLIFVVARGMENFGEQNYTGDSCRLTPDADIRLLEGLNADQKTLIKKYKIRSIQQLVGHPELVEVKKLSEIQMEEERAIQNRICEIPQYLLVTKLDYKFQSEKFVQIC
jgi:hypothetical protein